MTLLVAFSTPLGFLVALAAVPIVLLFLLKRKRNDLEIGSTMLWVQVLREQVARSPFRRPAEWLSLLLLVVSTLAIALAAAGIRLGGGDGARRELVLVIDTTASMATKEDGVRRIDRAKESVIETLNGMRDEDLATLIEAGGRPRILGHRSTDRDALIAVVKDLEPRPMAGDFRAAYDMAVQEAQSRSDEGESSAKLVLFSDFAFPVSSWLPADREGLEMTLVTCGEKAPNAGIVHVSVSSGSGIGHLLITLAANGGGGHDRTLALFKDDELIDAKEVILEAGARISTAFEVSLRHDEESAEYRLELQPEDGLPMDDRAFVGVIERLPPRAALIGPSSPFLDRLPAVFPGLTYFKVEASELEEWADELAEPLDLAIYTEAPRKELARPVAPIELYLGCVPPGGAIQASGQLVSPQLFDWDRRSPWLRDIGFENLIVLESLRLEGPPTARTLVETSGGPQLMELEESGKTLLVWASGMDDSNLALMPSFPVLLRNLFGPGLGGLEGAHQEASTPLRPRAGLNRLRGTVDARVRAPDGDEQEATLWAREDFFWQGPLEVGIYTVESVPREGGAAMTVRRPIGVSLLSSDESTRDPDVPEIGPQQGGEVQIASVGSWDTEKPAWRWFLGLGLLCLFVEMIVWARPRLPWREEA